MSSRPRNMQSGLLCHSKWLRNGLRLYNPENVFISKDGGGAGNNWAKGGRTSDRIAVESKKLRDEVYILLQDYAIIS